MQVVNYFGPKRRKQLALRTEEGVQEAPSIQHETKRRKIPLWNQGPATSKRDVRTGLKDSRDLGRVRRFEFCQKIFQDDAVPIAADTKIMTDSERRVHNAKINTSSMYSLRPVQCQIPCAGAGKFRKAFPKRDQSIGEV